MFEDAYRRDNDRIQPDEALLRHLEVQMRDAEQERPADKKPRRRWTRMTTALVSCAAVLFAAGTGYFGWRNRPLPAPDTTKASVVSDYNDLYALVKSLEPKKGFFNFGGIRNESAALTDAEDAGAAANTGGGYSETNVQVDGVDEADIVKTDGAYIYILSNNSRIVIVRADGGTMEQTAEIPLEQGGSFTEAREFYVSGDRLAVLQSVYSSSGWGGYDAALNENTTLTVYDIADRSNPKKLNQLGQSGACLSSRLVGDSLYLLSTYTLSETVRKSRPETYIPCLYEGNEKAAMAADDIWIAASPSGRQYIVITATDIRNPTGHASAKSVFGCGQNLYANAENLLIASPQTVKLENGWNTQRTNLLRFSLKEGAVELAASGFVPGTTLNQFSMDEYQGVFRVVTTVYGGTETEEDGVTAYTPGESTNCLYTLDEELKVLGRLENLAPGERVYSVRFDGPIGYLVTFRQVDPLFAVDLTDPESPRVLSTLKIPGFSDYLHPYQDGLLFGFGQSADPETGITEGLKLSMFDVSDPTDVSEKHTLPLGYGWSEASYNHKAFLISAERNLIGFPTDAGYRIYGYSEVRGFYLRAELPIGADPYRIGGLYIGDTFYVAESDGLYAYSLDDFQETGTIFFD